MKTKIVTMLSIIGMAILSGCIAESGGKEKIEERIETDWCKIGTKITMPSPQGKQEPFIVKGMTLYNGNMVCEAEWTTKDESASRYFNENNSYIVVVTKDKSGKVIQKINVRLR